MAGEESLPGLRDWQSRVAAMADLRVPPNPAAGTVSSRRLFYPLLDMVRYHKFLIAVLGAGIWFIKTRNSSGSFTLLPITSHGWNKVPGGIIDHRDADRVAPLHARKMAALLQSATGSDRPVLLHYDTKAGHVGGTTPVSKRIEELTDEVSFLDWQLSGGIPDQKTR
jgi:prolyl oligopeptidase